MSIVVRRFEPSRRADFFAFHRETNGAGWCYCVAWWAPTWQGWGERTAQENRKAREQLLERGEYDGYLAYDAAVPVGWCQVGPRDRLQKLVAQFKLPPDPDTWAVTCFEVAPSHRRTGVATALLRETLRDLRARGVRRVEAFPKRGAGPEPGALWTGPEPMFLALGFKIVRDDPKRLVLAIDL